MVVDLFYNNFLTDSNYPFQVIKFEKICVINPEGFELCNLSTKSNCPIFPKYGYNREMEFKFLIKIDAIRINNHLIFDQFNSLKAIYICNKDLTSIFKLSNIKITNIQFSIKFDTILEIVSVIDISNCDVVTDDDDAFLIKTLLLSRS